jgi:hypothetical protein
MMVITIATIVTAVMSRLTSRRVPTGFVHSFTTTTTTTTSLTSIRRQRQQSISSVLSFSTPPSRNPSFLYRISSKQQYQKIGQYHSNYITRWMSSSDTEEGSATTKTTKITPAEERSDEEKERIKALREAKK